MSTQARDRGRVSNEAALDLVKAVQEQILDATSPTSRRSRTRLREARLDRSRAARACRPEGPHRGDLQVPVAAARGEQGVRAVAHRDLGNTGARRQGQGEEVGVPAGLRPLVSESLWGVEAAALAMSPVEHGIGVPPGTRPGRARHPGAPCRRHVGRGPEELAGTLRLSLRGVRLSRSTSIAPAGRIGRSSTASRRSSRPPAARRRPRAQPRRPDGEAARRPTPGPRHRHRHARHAAHRPFAVHPALKRQLTLLAGMGEMGLPGFYGESCLPGGSCWKEWRTTSGDRWSRRSRSRPCTPAATAS